MHTAPIAEYLHLALPYITVKNYLPEVLYLPTSYPTLPHPPFLPMRPWEQQTLAFITERKQSPYFQFSNSTAIFPLVKSLRRHIIQNAFWKQCRDAWKVAWLDCRLSDQLCEDRCPALHIACWDEIFIKYGFRSSKCLANKLLKSFCERGGGEM